MKKLTVMLMLILVMVSFTFAAGSKEQAPAAVVNDKTLVIGVPASFEEKWNPFLAENAYDQLVVNLIFEGIGRLNHKNELVSNIGSIDTNVVSDDKVVYTIHLNKGLKFSNGDPVTIDDYIYTYYVFADPSYVGPTTITSQDIDGILEYYYDDPNYKSTIDKFAEEVKSKYSQDTISKEDFLAYLVDTNLAGWYKGDPNGSAGGGLTFVTYIAGEGDQYKAKYDALSDKNDSDAILAILAEIEYTNYGQYYDPAPYYKKKLESTYIKGNLEDGVDVSEIRGIKKIDDYTATVTYNSINIYGDREVSGTVVPRNYYGKIVKGDVSKQLQNMKPVGVGPFKFVDYDANIVSLEANLDYWKGTPKLGRIKVQFVPASDLITSLANNTIDVAEITGTKENLKELNDLGLDYTLTDNNGYGYAGMNAKNLSKNVRKGLFTLMNREPSVRGYYADIAKVIERPMTTVLAEYPQDAPVYYPYNPAKALEYFKAAGYSQVNGKLVNEKGEQLVVSAYIGGSGQGDHPGYAMLTQAANDLAAMGGELQIQDVQFSVLQAAMNDGTADIYVLAWGASNSADKTTIYRSNGGQNRSGVNNPELDRLIDLIKVTPDLTKRSALVAQMLDVVMDEAVELPLYQRKNILGYNGSIIDMRTIPSNTSAFYNYLDEIYLVDLLQ